MDKEPLQINYKKWSKTVNNKSTKGQIKMDKKQGKKFSFIIFQNTNKNNKKEIFVNHRTRIR